jgi:Zn-dependent peptidase ImmA (M78 family)
MNILEAEMQRKAFSFREQYGLTQEAPLQFESLLRKLEVMSVYRPLSSDFSGMAQKQEEQRFMLVNSNQTLGRQNFTICHELFHLFIQENFRAMVCKAGYYPKDNETELKADLFAAALLIPEIGVRQFIPSHEFGKDLISINTLLAIEHYYRCSRSALLRVLKKLGYIGSQKYEEFCQDVKWKAWQHGYSGELYEKNQVSFVIGEYANLAKRLFDASVISEIDYLSTLDEMGLQKPATEETCDELF